MSKTYSRRQQNIEAGHGSGRRGLASKPPSPPDYCLGLVSSGALTSSLWLMVRYQCISVRRHCALVGRRMGGWGAIKRPCTHHSDCKVGRHMLNCVCIQGTMWVDTCQIIQFMQCAIRIKVWQNWWKLLLPSNAPLVLVPINITALLESRRVRGGNPII